MAGAKKDKPPNMRKKYQSVLKSGSAEDFGQDILDSVGLKEYPEGSSKAVKDTMEALQRLGEYARNPDKAERVTDAEIKELKQLRSKAELNPEKYQPELVSLIDDINSRRFYYDKYDEARNRLIESIAPYVSSTEESPSSPYYQNNVRRAERSATTEKINDVLKRVREATLREKSENQALAQDTTTTTPEPTSTETAPQDSYDPAKMKQWLDKTIAERRALRNVAGPSEIPNSQITESPSSIGPARVGTDFKRQLLADEVKRFAEGESKETAKTLLEQGSEIGVDRNQLSNLYKRYRAESEKGPTKLDGGSTFEQEEEQARARSKASGAFGGDDWRGRSSANSVSTPRLDQYESDKFGARPMGSERRIITSPEGQMRLMARKAAKAGIDVGQLISANRGDVSAAFAELEEAGFAPKGIRSEEEVKARPALMAQRREAKAELLQRQAEQARAEREAAERAAKEEVARKEADRIAKEEAARKEAERLAKEEADRKEKERLAKEEEEKKEKERASQQGTSNPNSTQLTDSSSETSNPNSRPLRDSSPRTANPNSRPTNPNRRA